ncbi:MAG: HD-GYP domain-containing protein [Lachnospiraceae bacterium]|nr:HD-GYP domain-containing protein [Lachnospiraceae bacterium]
MKTEFVSVSDAIPGMIVACDIYTFNNILLIDKGASLTDRVITRLMFYNIEQIEIIVSPDIEMLGDNFDLDTLESLSEEERAVITEFSKTTSDCVAKFKASLSSTFVDNNELDTLKLLDELNSVLNKSRNSFHLLSLLNIMKERDDVIFHHSINVALLASMIGNMLHFSEKDMNVLKLGAILHDIGKLAIPQKILATTNRLSEKDFAIVKTHPSKGYELLTKQEVPISIKNIALQHHERCDGSGYPNGLKAEEIDKFSKIIAIADCYEAMTSPRAYRDIINPFEVIEFFEAEGFRLFDAEYLVPFMHGIVDSYINKKVMLSNNVKGTIILINKLALSRPMVKLDTGSFVDLYTDRSISIVRVYM